MKKVRPFYANGQTFLLISSDLFLQKVRPFYIKGLTLNTSPPQPKDSDPAAIHRLHSGLGTFHPPQRSDMSHNRDK